VATTHLDPLKALAFGDPRFANAAVGFDPEALAPTYRVEMGLPGQSSALEIARRGGLSEALIARARTHLDSATGPLGAALAALDGERARLAEVREACDIAREALAQERENLQAQAERLTARERELAAGARRELLDELDRARAEVAELLEGLRAKPEVPAGREAQRAIDRHRGEQRAALAEPPAPPPGRPPVPGQFVRSRTLALEGELLEIAGPLGLVAMGSLKLRQPLADLIPIPGKRPSPRRFPGGKDERIAQGANLAAGGDLPTGVTDCDLRGLRSEEALRAAESFLDRAYSQGVGEVRLIHGLGTGALKASLRKLLRGSSYVRSYRADDARGDGATVVELA
jgi:DNA mismatch repair protein MutS2